MGMGKTTIIPKGGTVVEKDFMREVFKKKDQVCDGVKLYELE